MTELNFHKKTTESLTDFEVTLQVRDKNGKPTGKTKTFSSEKCTDISNWYDKQKPRKKRNNKKKSRNS